MTAVLLFAGCATPLTPEQHAQARRVFARLNDPAENAIAEAEAKATASPLPIDDKPKHGHPPVLRVRTEPIYPFGLRRQGVQGVVWIAFAVTPSGDVADAKAVGDSDAPFVDAAVHAVSQWKFRPAIDNGVPVYCRIVVPIAFTLE